MNKTPEHAARKRSRSRKGAPGILDVALRAGVSGATVSRYFNNPDVVRPDTRVRIEKAARELGYIRDRIAGALHGKMSGSVGLIVPTIDHAIFSELIEAFSDRLHQNDRTMLIASHNYDLEREVDIVRSLLERRIDAVALVGRDHSSAAVEMLKVRGIPVVTLWNAIGVQGIPSIGTDNRQVAIDITEHLIRLGHRQIALLFPDTQFNDRARDRKTGALQALKSAGISVPDHWNLPCPYDMATAKSVAIQLLENNPPTAFVCGNDIIAHGVIHAATRLGIKVPAQVSVVGIGDFRGSSAIEPPLTTVRLPACRIGQLAAEALIDKLSFRDGAIRPDHVLPTQLMLRESTARACR
ncbi:LacI family DNA-binding transcriptional regulator [Granulosicoccus antarcticus]|uniref:HTH-type transcriptional repressor CytR n=1 Tax=Granulosicoccus antarcticus IMCC3135 TaxID=1192854 RepID=A0A2Z2NT20_9GAMM|nr:LacI family DNA-binding transcriptional regulator [Granulosicoccus antarcticus]ASJ74692.1 HTH-type transcriptional repressor CytR [Granulosicoccus antarcticus IMCC3135]